MSGFGTLWRIRTRKHVRTSNSVPISTRPARATWPRLQETELLTLQGKRLEARQRLHEQRRACKASLLWP